MSSLGQMENGRWKKSDSGGTGVPGGSGGKGGPSGPGCPCDLDVI